MIIDQKLFHFAVKNKSIKSYLQFNKTCHTKITYFTKKTNKNEITKNYNYDDCS